MSWKCFWVEETSEIEIGLRRYAATASCSIGYHDALVPLGRIPARRDAEGYGQPISEDEYADDPRWPTECECGYAFVEDDRWQVWTERLWRRPDTGEEWRDRALPPGAMLDGFWHPQKGSDGIALVVVLPPAVEDTRAHWWHVDGASRSNGVAGAGWTRTGDPKAAPSTVSASPSILTDTYHGFLQAGVLTDSLSDRPEEPVSNGHAVSVTWLVTVTSAEEVVS